MRLALLALLLLAARPAALADGTPESRARLRSLEALLDEEDVGAAQREWEVLNARHPEGLEALDFFAGRIAFLQGRYDEAIERLEAAGLEDRSGSYLHLAKETRRITHGDVRVESPHFVFFHPPGKDAVLAPWALETLEAQRAALLEDLGYAPPGKVRVEVVNDAGELSRVSTLSKKEIDQTGTIAICKFNKLMVTSPKAVLTGYDWQDTLAHEYTHLVVTQRGHNTVPIWLQEAIAKYLESRWHGPAGRALPPSSRALLADRIRRGALVPFAKMHPSMAKLPSWQDAATAFAEVFFAAEYLSHEHGVRALRTIVEQMGAGRSDQQAVEAATGRSFAAFEHGWMAYLRSQPAPKALLPSDRVVLRDAQRPEKTTAKGREIGFQDFREVEEAPARRAAHLGELFRERGRFGAAAEEFGRAHAAVGPKYESISNKYALALLAVRRVDEAERVLQSSLQLHPGSAATQVHLGRIYLSRSDWGRARAAYREALSLDPFDPEVHLALVRAAQGLQDVPLAQRARAGAGALTGLSPDQVDAVVKRLPTGPADLSNVDVPPPKPEARTRKAPTPPPAPKSNATDTN